MAGPESKRPHEDYTHRLKDRQSSRAELAWRERLLGNGRVVVFVAALLLAYVAFGPPQLLSRWWLLAPLAIFSVLLVRHEGVTRALLRVRRAVAFYERGLAGLGLRPRPAVRRDLRRTRAVASATGPCRPCGGSHRAAGARPCLAGRRA